MSQTVVVEARSHHRIREDIWGPSLLLLRSTLALVGIGVLGWLGWLGGLVNQ